jgi:hypothetical protein
VGAVTTAWGWAGVVNRWEGGGRTHRTSSSACGAGVSAVCASSGPAPIAPAIKSATRLASRIWVNMRPVLMVAIAFYFLGESIRV